MGTLQLTHYKNKGIYAYLCPIEVRGSEICRGVFINGNPIDEGDNEQRFYQGRSATVEFDLARLPDGVYEWKEAIGHKSAFGYIEIRDGGIVRRWDNQEDLISELSPLPELPELEGTARQIEYAENLRARAIRSGYPIEKAISVISAKPGLITRTRCINSARKLR